MSPELGALQASLEQRIAALEGVVVAFSCLLYTSPSPRDRS